MFHKKYVTLKGLFIGIIVIGFLGLLFTNCAKKPAEFAIGAICPLTGDAAVYGAWFKKGLDLAVEEINAAGGINGIKVKIIYEDSRALPEDGVSAMSKLVNIQKVPVVIGAMASSVTLAVAPIAERTKTVLISPASSSPKITQAGDYIFRNWPSDLFEGREMADFAYSELGIKKIAILYINNDYGLGIKEVFEKHFERLGGEIIITERYEQGGTDFRTQLTKIKDRQPEAIYLPTMAKEAGLILKQAKEIGVKSRFLSIMGIEAPTMLEIAGDAAEGVIYSYPGFDPDSPYDIVQEFQEKYKVKYGEKAEAFAAHAYDAMKIVALAIERGGYTPEGIKDALYKIKDFPGVAGLTTFDENGDVIKQVMIKIIKEGKFHIYSK